MNQNNKLPKDWKLVKIIDISDINPKLPNRDEIDREIEVQFLPMKLVEATINKIHLTETKKIIDVMKGSYTPFINNDIIFAKVTPCMENGKIAVVNNLKNGIGFGSSEFHVLRPKKEVLNKYLFHYIIQDSFRNKAANEMTGAVGLRRVPKKFIEDSLIPIPPIKIQSSIVSKIDELFSELDKGIEDLKTAQQQLKIYKQSILKFAFEGKLTKEWRNKSLKTTPNKIYWEFKDKNKYSKSFEIKIPNIWIALPIGNICEFQQGMQIAKNTRLNKESEGCLPILRIKNYKDSFKTDVEYVEINESSLIAEKEDIIMTRTGESRGNILTGFRGVFHNNTFRINFEKSHLNREYLIHYLKSTKIQNFIKENSGRTGQPDLTHRNFGPCPIAIPTLEEQCKIVQEIESRLSVADKMDESITQSLQQAEALRQSILKKAFSGKLI